jgi:hypothetical protein
VRCGEATIALHFWAGVALAMLLRQRDHSPRSQPGAPRSVSLSWIVPKAEPLPLLDHRRAASGSDEVGLDGITASGRRIDARTGPNLWSEKTGDGCAYPTLLRFLTPRFPAEGAVSS